MMPATSVREISLPFRGANWRADTANAFDLSIPLMFDGTQPNCFGAPSATSRPLEVGTFVGDVRHGGSCNCATYTITPHCNGTHTECVGHVTAERIAIRDISVPAYIVARVVTVAPVSASQSAENSDPPPHPEDLLITLASLEEALKGETLHDASAIVVRTLPNDPSKRHRVYDGPNPAPFLTAECANWLVAQGIEHLLVDLPSIDRADDAGRLTAHRIFFGVPPMTQNQLPARRPNATVTELIYVDEAIADGWYLLSLQIAPFVADAAPSRPLLMPLFAS